MKENDTYFTVSKLGFGFFLVLFLFCSGSKGMHFSWLQILLAQNGEKVLGNMKNQNLLHNVYNLEIIQHQNTDQKKKNLINLICTINLFIPYH